MAIETFGLMGSGKPIVWVVAAPPAGVKPLSVVTGHDDKNVGMQVALATWNGHGEPPTEMMRKLHRNRKGKKAFSLVVALFGDSTAWLLGPESELVPVALSRTQAVRVLQAALSEPDGLAARLRIAKLLKAVSTSSSAGVTNEGLFARHFLETSVPQRPDFTQACEEAEALVQLSDEPLIKALGFSTKRTAGHALLLTSDEVPRAVAVLLQSDEQFDAKSTRFSVSPVAWGLNIAAKQEVPWLIVMRGSRLRLHPARPGVGVGQRGQADTWFEIDLSVIDAEQSALLPLVFSAAALAPGGSTQQILDGSAQYAVALGERLRARVYDEVMPRLSEALAFTLAAEQEGSMTADRLELAYRLSLKVLFRLLFQAYAEDSRLLPYGRNEQYDRHALKTRAKDLAASPDQAFAAESTSIWDDLSQVWRVIDSGDKDWDVPAYNGGLFGSDPALHPENHQLDAIRLSNAVMGPVLAALLVDDVAGGGAGPVDFRSLSVREFGTIYEGLLESSLSVAPSDLTTKAIKEKGKPKEIYAPAADGDTVVVPAGGVYFHSKSGERKATGTYFTPHIIVEHLLQRSLDPALTDHLASIQTLLDSGDEAAAAESFFDFRVADLAIGSAHFLTAAIDHIEAAMRDFLTEHPLASITDELRSLDTAARAALGDDAAADEVDPAQLLRRQIARRCIYGLDINPMAVELARLAIWITTFVPGLPMSTLDHNLVAANSLTGVGTIEEALGVLEPGSQGGQLSVYSEAITSELDAAKALLMDVANSTEATKADAHRNAEAIRDAQISAEPAKLLFDAVVATRLKLIDPTTVIGVNELQRLAKDPDIAAAVSTADPAHLPYLFPEVFLRDNPGFDVILGNPPWEKLKVETHAWWAVRFPGLRSMSQKDKNAAIEIYIRERPDLYTAYLNELAQTKATAALISAGPYPGIGAGDIDLMAAFAWRFLHGIRFGGTIGVVLPRTAFAGSACVQWRREIMRDGNITDLTMVVNNRQWVFPAIHPQYTVAALSYRRCGGGERTVALQGPYNSREAFLAGTGDPSAVATFPADEVLGWTDTAAFPLLPDAASLPVFTQMRSHPSFGNGEGVWKFRPHRETDTTKEKKYFDFNLESPAEDHTLPVLTGASFNLWDPDFGEPYAYANPQEIEDLLQSRRQRQIRLASSVFYGMSKEWADDPATLPMKHPRIAFRDVARATDSRTLLCVLLPPEYAVVHKAPYLFRQRGTTSDEAFLLGVMSSLSMDWYTRRFVEVTMSFTLLNGFPVPRPDSDDPLRLRVVEIAGRLAAVDDRFTVWAAEIGVPVGSVTTHAQKDDLIAELDALVGLLYGLDRAQFSHIFETFHVGWDYRPRLNASLAHFDSWATKMGDSHE